MTKRHLLEILLAIVLFWLAVEVLSPLMQMDLGREAQSPSATNAR